MDSPTAWDDAAPPPYPSDGPAQPRSASTTAEEPASTPAGGGPDRLPPAPPYGTATTPTTSPRIPPDPEPAPRRDWLDLVGAAAAGALGALAVVALLFAAGILGPTTTEPAAPAPPRGPVTQVITPRDEPGLVEAVAAKVVPSIVTIEVGEENVDGFEAIASGSGVVFDDAGHIVTNAHVVEGSSAAKVILQDGRIYDAVLVGADPRTDLAVLEVDADGLVPIELGSTEELALGSPAIAVGNPLGQVGGASVTAGVISAFDRQVVFGTDDRLVGMLQTDAPITRGSSGGGLVDAQGRLIGITTAIGVSDAGAEGIGYATPVELVERIVDELIETGTVEHAFLGVLGTDHYRPTGDGGLVVDGAEISEILDDTAAAEAGLEPGDVIVAVDDEPVTAMDDLIAAIRLRRVGEEVEVTIRRGEETLVLPVVLGARPDDV